MRKLMTAAVALMALTTPALAQRATPAQMEGVTFDNVTATGIASQAATLASDIGGYTNPVVRLVTDSGTASSYASALGAINPYAYVMLEPIDSFDMSTYTPTTAATRFTSFVGTLGGSFDILEIGNELNGSWLGTNTAIPSNTMQIVYAGYNAVKGGTAAPNTELALTFFYEGETYEAHNCIDTTGNGNDMFTWINTQFQLSLPVASRSTQTEAIRTGAKHVLVSWYPDQCPNEIPNWSQVFATLSTIFPNAKVGFGELGTASPGSPSPTAFEYNELENYVTMRADVGNLPSNFEGGGFWWYAQQEMLPISGNAFTTKYLHVLQTYWTTLP